MGQWSFATNTESMEASIAAHKAAMDTAGWAKPLNPAVASLKIKEVCDYLEAQNVSNWSTAKRSGSDLVGDSPKRTCIGWGILDASVVGVSIAELLASTSSTEPVVTLPSFTAPAVVENMYEITDIAKEAASEVTCSED
jgi:hypothetical protein